MSHMTNKLKTLGISLLLLLPLALPVSAQDADGFSQAELDSMLAPVALYPDTLLSHILIAATYPLEVVQADRWAKANASLEGQDAVNAVEKEDWDPSVKALVAFPRLLAQMSDDLAWTQRLGDAFLVDEASVVASIQNLRQRAHETGNLESNDYVTIHHEPETIIIEPARREVVYIPYYDTRVVYGTWWWEPTYAPVYWHYPSHYSWHNGFYWSSGISVHNGFFFSSFYWPSQRVVVVHHHHPHRFYTGRSVAHYQGARHWRHDPYHRRGVNYRHEQVGRHYHSHRPSMEVRRPQQENRNHRQNRADEISRRLGTAQPARQPVTRSSEGRNQTREAINQRRESSNPSLQRGTGSTTPQVPRENLRENRQPRQQVPNVREREQAAPQPRREQLQRPTVREPRPQTQQPRQQAPQTQQPRANPGNIRQERANSMENRMPQRAEPRQQQAPRERLQRPQ